MSNGPCSARFVIVDDDVVEMRCGTCGATADTAYGLRTGCDR